MKNVRDEVENIKAENGEQKLFHGPSFWTKEKKRTLILTLFRALLKNLVRRTSNLKPAIKTMTQTMDENQLLRPRHFWE